MVVANAGIVPPWAETESMDLDLWDAVFAVNVRGVMATIKAAVPAMITSPFSVTLAPLVPPDRKDVPVTCAAGLPFTVTAPLGFQNALLPFRSSGPLLPPFCCRNALVPLRITPPRLLLPGPVASTNALLPARVVKPLTIRPPALASTKAWNPSSVRLPATRDPLVSWMNWLVSGSTTPCATVNVPAIVSVAAFPLSSSAPIAMPPEAVGAFGVPAGTSTLSPVPGTAAGLQFPAVVHAVLTAPVHVLSPPPVPVAAKVTAVRPGALAVKLCAPTVVPSVAPMLASPAPSVTTTALSTLPPPVATANVTGTPPTGSPSLPSTRTPSGSASRLPMIPLCASPLTFTSVAGAAAMITVVESVTPVGVTALTVTVSRAAGAVNSPAPLIVPPLALHAT